MTKAVTHFYVDGWDKLTPDERDTLTQRASNANPGLPVEGCDSKDIPRLDGVTGWFDATLEADHWFALPEVAPVDAALLLCQYNPNESTFDDAKRCANGETAPRELVQLQQRFVALQATEPGTRTLRDWLVAARSMGLKYHSWIDGYAETLPAPAIKTVPVKNAPDTTETALTVSDIIASKLPKHTKRMTWKDLAWDYVVKTYHAGTFKTAHTFYTALVNRAEKEPSPFTLHDRELFLKEIGQSLAEKTLANHMRQIKAEPR